MQTVGDRIMHHTHPRPPPRPVSANPICPGWSPAGGSPYGAPPPRATKSRTGMWIAIACGVALLLVVVIAGGGLGAWLLLRGSDDDPGPAATSSADPADDPTGEPTDDPTAGEGTTTLTIKVTSSEEVDRVETDDGPLDPVNGTFFGAEVELTNEADEEIGLAGENFTFYDDQRSEERRVGKERGAGCGAEHSEVEEEE